MNTPNDSKIEQAWYDRQHERLEKEIANLHRGRELIREERDDLQHRLTTHQTAMEEAIHLCKICVRDQAILLLQRTLDNDKEAYGGPPNETADTDHT